MVMESIKELKPVIGELVKQAVDNPQIYISININKEEIEIVIMGNEEESEE